MTDPKKNALYLQGESNAGKTYMMHGLVPIEEKAGYHTTSKEFPFGEAVFAPVILINELTIESPAKAELYKNVMGGEPTQVNIKNKPSVLMGRKPCIITNNIPMWKYVLNEKKPPKNRCYCYMNLIKSEVIKKYNKYGLPNPFYFKAAFGEMDCNQFQGIRSVYFYDDSTDSETSDDEEKMEEDVQSPPTIVISDDEEQGSEAKVTEVPIETVPDNNDNECTMVHDNLEEVRWPDLGNHFEWIERGNCYNNVEEWKEWEKITPESHGKKKELPSQPWIHWKKRVLQDYLWQEHFNNHPECTGCQMYQREWERHISPKGCLTKYVDFDRANSMWFPIIALDMEFADTSTIIPYGRPVHPEKWVEQIAFLEKKYGKRPNILWEHWPYHQQFLATIASLEEPMEEDRTESKDLDPSLKCVGCEEEQGNQEAHTGPGGCLEQPPTSPAQAEVDSEEELDFGSPSILDAPRRAIKRKSVEKEHLEPKRLNFDEL